MLQNVHHNSLLHLEMPIPQVKRAIPGAMKVTFSMRYNACVLEVKLKHTVHSYYGWIVSEVSRGDFHPQSHPCPLQKHPNEWNWCLVTDIYKRVANNNLLLLAYMRIFFFCHRIKAHYQRDSLFYNRTGTYLLVIKGLPEEGTEWENRVSFMLVTGLGGLKKAQCG